MRDDGPLFSIITVTYNAADTVGVTMRSVASQTCTDYEHIVVDGASTDGTLPTVLRHATERTRYKSEPDKGIYDAMNRGIGMSRGRYLIFMNAGDSFHSPETLGHIARAIADNDTPGIVYGQTLLVDRDGRVTGERHLKAPRRLTLDSFKDGMVVCHQAMAVLKRITGLYSMRYRLSADYEWVVKCLQHSRHNVYLDEVIVDYLDEGMTTRNHKRSLRERFAIMCHYYGTLPTVARHLRFAIRYTGRRLKGKKQ